MFVRVCQNAQACSEETECQRGVGAGAGIVRVGRERWRIHKKWLKIVWNLKRGLHKCCEAERHWQNTTIYTFCMSHLQLKCLMTFTWFTYEIYVYHGRIQQGQCVNSSNGIAERTFVFWYLSGCKSQCSMKFQI